MRGPYGPPASWINKPPLGAQLNPGHDLAIGLQDLFLFNERGGKTATNLGPSGVGAITSSAFSWPTGQMPYGGGLAVGAAGQTCATGFTVSLPTQVTMVLVFQRTAAAAVSGLLLAVRQSATANNQVSFQYDGGAANLGMKMTNSTGTDRIANIAVANITTNTWYVLVAAFDRAAGTISAWLNSTAFSGSPGAASAVTTNSHAIALGGSATGGGSQGATVAMFARYNRLLLAQEAAQLVENPWCMVAPPALRRYWVVSGGTAISIALADTLTFLDTQVTDDALTRSSVLTLAEAETTDTALTRASILTLVEAMQAAAGASPADTLTPTETIVGSGGQAGADTAAFIEALLSAGGPALADTATLAESSSQGAGSTQSDPITTVDTAATSTALSGTDTAALIDALLSAGGPSLADLTTLVEAFLASGALTAAADALSAADTLIWGTITTLLLSLADTLTLLESVATNTAAVQADALSPVDLASLAGGLARTDAAILADSGATGGSAALADALNSADALAAAGALSQADAVTLAEQVAAWLVDGRLTLPADALTTLDTLGTLAGALSVTDSLSPADRLLFRVIQRIVHHLGGTLTIRQSQGGTLSIRQSQGGTLDD